MEQVTLSAQRRTEYGTRPSRRLRRDGLVPAVVYGRGVDPVSVIVNSRELYSALHSDAGANAIINVSIEGDASHLTVAREVQRHPVRGDITHLDFIKVFLDEAIQAEVALEFEGTPIAVREDGAIVDTIATSVMVEALPANVPTSITVDISGLALGDTLTIADLPEVDGVTYLDEPDHPVATTSIPAAVESEASAAAGAEGEATAGAGDDES